MRIVIQGQRFTLTRHLYRHIRRHVLRAVAAGGPSRVDVMFEGCPAGGVTRCRVEMQAGRRAAMFAEAVDRDARLALARCLQRLAPWLPTPGPSSETGVCRPVAGPHGA